MTSNDHPAIGRPETLRRVDGREMRLAIGNKPVSI